MVAEPAAQRPEITPATVRKPVGIWAQWPTGARWSNEGMTRLVGFLIEGVAKTDEFMFRIVLPDSIREAAEADLATLQAVKGIHYSVHSPSDSGAANDDPVAMADFANDHVDVAGWLSVFPTFTYAKRLKAPITTIFPDAIPIVFHEFSDLAWGPNGNHLNWRLLVEEMLAAAKRVVVFSEHVADAQASAMFGVPSASIDVVPHAPPDLESLLPFVTNRNKTDASKRQAADLLRQYLAERRHPYLTDFPFEDCAYLAVSTQDRVTKNLIAMAQALNHIIRHDRVPLKVIATTPLHFGAKWTPLPGFLEDNLILNDFVSIPDMPRDVHAAFYHCATAAVHPSIFEGGHAPFPFYEAVSVGTPCLVAKGPHVDELARAEPDLLNYAFDPNDQPGLIALIKEALSNPGAMHSRQMAIFERCSKRGWDDVALGYARAATRA